MYSMSARIEGTFGKCRAPEGNPAQGPCPGCFRPRLFSTRRRQPASARPTPAPPADLSATGVHPQ
eukprot:scaffold3791_cov390-Prasinococcus_capsulatus_cf.AAC.25